MAKLFKTSLSAFLTGFTPVDKPVQVTVNDSETDSVISIYADADAGESLGNPFFVTSEAVEFYSGAGLVDIIVTAGEDTQTFSNVRVGFVASDFDTVNAAALDGATDKLLVYKAADKTFRHHAINSLSGAE